MEDVVGPVAVVDVPVEDQDALGAPAIERAPRGHRDVVEQAEAHRARGQRVVARRPVQRGAEARAVAAQQRVDQRHRPARRVQRGAVGALGDDRVGVQRAAARRDRPPRCVARRPSGCTASDDLALGRRATRARPSPASRARRARARWRRSAPGARDASRCRAPATTGGEAGAARASRYGTRAWPIPRASRPTWWSSAPAPRASTPRSPGPAPGRSVALVSATPLARTASYWAQGGLAAALAVGRLARPASRGHRARRARPRAHERRDGPLPRGAAHGRRPRAPRRALRRRPPRQPRARPRGRALAPARRPRRRQRDRPARRAPALGRRGRDAGRDRHRRRPRRRRCGSATGAAWASSARTGARSTPAR